MSRSFRITFNKTKQKNTMIRTLVNKIKLKTKYTQYYNYLNYEFNCNRRPYRCFLGYNTSKRAIDLEMGTWK